MIEREIIQFQSGAFMLTAQVDSPASTTKAKIPGVIFCHGFTGNRFESRRLYSLLSRELATRGILTFRFDHRGCGDSEGDFTVFTKAGLLEDLDSALKQFLAIDSVDQSRTAVVGYSLGGLSANYLLNQRPAFLTAALWAPVAQPDIIRERLATYPDFRNYQTKGYFDYGGTRVSAGYVDEIGTLNPVKWSQGYNKPVLIVQGSDDPIVKSEQARIYMKARDNNEDRLLIIPEGDHAFGAAENVDLVVSESEKWLCEKLLLT